MPVDVGADAGDDEGDLGKYRMHRPLKCDNQTLYLIPVGEYKIVKYTKYGAYIDIDGSRMFIPKTDVDIEALEKEAIANAGEDS